MRQAVAAAAFSFVRLDRRVCLFFFSEQCDVFFFFFSLGVTLYRVCITSIRPPSSFFFSPFFRALKSLRLKAVD